MFNHSVIVVRAPCPSRRSNRSFFPYGLKLMLAPAIPSASKYLLTTFDPIHSTRTATDTNTMPSHHEKSHHSHSQSNGSSHRSRHSGGGSYRTAGQSGRPSYVPGGGASMLPSTTRRSQGGSSRSGSRRNNPLLGPGKISWEELTRIALANAHALPDGDRVELCKCLNFEPTEEQWRSGDREAFRHLAKHAVHDIPDNAQERESKLVMIQICRFFGVEPADIGLTHWGMLAPDPSRYHIDSHIPNMRHWTVEVQIRYYEEDDNDIPKDQSIIDGLRAAYRTLGCLNHRHYILPFGESANSERLMAEGQAAAIACHERRTGHRYQGGCCGGGTYLTGSEGDTRVYSGSRSGTQSRSSRSARFDMGSVAASMAWGAGSRTRHSSGRSGGGHTSHSHSGGGESRRPSQSHSAHSQSSRSRTSQAGWRPPNSRSEHGVSVERVLGTAQSLHASENVSTILPGESMAGFNDRQDRRRAAGQKKHVSFSQHEAGQGSQRSWVPKASKR